MSHKHYHDPVRKIVYRVPTIPDVQDKKDRSGKILIRNVSVSVDIVRADNVFENHMWKQPLKEYWHQPFDNIGDRYSNKEIVIDYFFQHRLSGLQEIDSEEYEQLRIEYEAQAKGNK